MSNSPCPGNKQTAPEGFTRKLTEKICRIRFDDLDQHIRDDAAQLFIDGIAVAVAGAHQERPPKILAEQVKAAGGLPQSTIFYFGFKSSLAQAAYVNGASMHVLDFEPMWSPPNHQLSTCLPAILALAEHRSVPGKEVITALVKGTEMMSRLRWAAPAQRDLRVVDLHPPGFVGPMGAAVAAAHLLNLNPEQTANALGIVASRCAALWPNNGTDTKCLHSGLASRNGLEAALLAEQGFNANPDIFTAPRGYVETYFDKDEFLWDELLAFGDTFRMVEPGYAIKMWPSQFGTHYIFTACHELKPQIADVSEIESVVVTCPDLDYPDRPNPATGLAGKFSWQYAAALALLDYDIDLHSFSDERRFAPDIEMLLPKVSLDRRSDFKLVLEQNDTDFVVTVTLKSGEVLEARCNGPKGSWGKEPITREEHEKKLRSCLALALDDAAVDQVLQLGFGIHDLSGSEVQEFVALLGRQDKLDSASVAAAF
jgi:2-methylcitrate dehydratase PrpD